MLCCRTAASNICRAMSTALAWSDGVPLRALWSKIGLSISGSIACKSCKASGHDWSSDCSRSVASQRCLASRVLQQRLSTEWTAYIISSFSQCYQQPGRAMRLSLKQCVVNLAYTAWHLQPPGITDNQSTDENAPHSGNVLAGLPHCRR